MYKVDVYLRVRRAVMVDRMSMREAARVFGLHLDTVRKMLAYSVPPGYRRQTPPKRPKLEPFTKVIDRILEEDLRRPRKAGPIVVNQNLLIIDEMGFVPLSRTGAELLFEVFSQRYERGSILVTTNLPFDEWTEVFGSERLTGALLDRLTHHVHILEMNGESYRLKDSRQSVAAPSSAPDRADAV